MISRMKIKSYVPVLWILILTFISGNSFATTARPGTSSKVLSEGTVVGGSGGGGTVTADLYSGTMSDSIPIRSSDWATWYAAESGLASAGIWKCNISQYYSNAQKIPAVGYCG